MRKLRDKNLINDEETAITKAGEAVLNEVGREHNHTIKNAEAIFKKAVEVLEGDIPSPSNECEVCIWIERYNDEIK